MEDMYAEHGIRPKFPNQDPSKLIQNENVHLNIASPAHDNNDYQDLEPSQSCNIEPVSNVNDNRSLKVFTPPAIFEANSTIIPRAWPSEKRDHTNNIILSAATKSERKFVCPRSYSYESSSNESTRLVTRAISLIEPPLRNLDESLNEPPVPNECESSNASESVDSSTVEHVSFTNVIHLLNIQNMYVSLKKCIFKLGCTF